MVGPRERLDTRLRQLDALLCVVAGGDTGPDGLTDFQRFNDEIQQEVLQLASSLAQEAHELNLHIQQESPEPWSLAWIQQVDKQRRDGAALR